MTSTFVNIVDSGNRYLVALILFLVVAVIVATLAVVLSLSPLGTAGSALWVVVVGLAVSAFGFAAAALSGLPVWVWARQAADGSVPVREAADRSEGLASFSQTALLMFGLGGLLIAMSVLGVVAVVHRWTPRVLFLGTVVAAAAIVMAGVVSSGPVFWLALGALPMMWAFAFGLVLVARGRFGQEHDLSKAAVARI